MYKYIAFGLNTCSEIFLPELAEANFDKPDLVIRRGKFDVFSGKTIVEGEYFRVTENSIYRFWDDIGKFKISRGNEIIIEEAKDVNEVVLRSFILGTVFASLLYQRGLFVLHASAVNINNEVIAFLGNKGYGKSTTAMTFYKEGYPIISDDYIAVDPENSVPLVYPGFPSLRLSYNSRNHGNFSLKKIYYKDHEIDKLHVSVNNNFSLDKIPLKKLYMLKRGEKLKISNFKPQDSLMKLVENTFGISRFKKDDFVHNLNQCASLLDHVNVSLLEVPDSLEKLQNVVELIKEDIE
jgi:hypothetical protein